MLLLIERPSGRCLLLALLALICLLAGCQSPHLDDSVTRAPTLAADLRQLSPAVDEMEAERAAETALKTAVELAHAYHAVQPAWFQNILVNTGFRERGLCYHWADDLATPLQELGLHTLEIHRIVARPATSHEHNGVAISAWDQSPLEGLVLDAWRHAGRLYWARVKNDKYPWQILEQTAESQK